VTVNHARNQRECCVRLPVAGIGDGQWRLDDLTGDASCLRE
jgi:hypothetical protein